MKKSDEHSHERRISEEDVGILLCSRHDLRYRNPIRQQRYRYKKAGDGPRNPDIKQRTPSRNGRAYSQKCTEGAKKKWGRQEVGIAHINVINLAGHEMAHLV